MIQNYHCPLHSLTLRSVRKYISRPCPTRREPEKHQGSSSPERSTGKNGCVSHILQITFSINRLLKAAQWSSGTNQISRGQQGSSLVSVTREAVGMSCRPNDMQANVQIKMAEQSKSRSQNFTRTLAVSLGWRDTVLWCPVTSIPPTANRQGGSHHRTMVLSPVSRI